MAVSQVIVWMKQYGSDKIIHIQLRVFNNNCVIGVINLKIDL